MSLEREMSRGFFLNARLGVNGSQNASRSLGTSAARGVASGLAAVTVVICRTSPWEGLVGADDGSGVVFFPVGAGTTAGSPPLGPPPPPPPPPARPAGGGVGAGAGGGAPGPARGPDPPPSRRRIPSRRD